MLHAIYEQIHDLVVFEHDAERARSKLEELIAISRTLPEQIAILEQEVNALHN